MFQLVVLLLCVPLQLGLVYFFSDFEWKLYESVDYVRSAVKRFDLWNVVTKLMKYPVTYDETETSSGSADGEGREDSNSGLVRGHRPEKVFLRVGYVVLHIQLRCTGVIIGWTVSDDGEPTYEVLTKHPEAKEYKVEAKQQLLYPLQYTEVTHPELEKYFKGYDGATQYTPLPWLRNLYPLD